MFWDSDCFILSYTFLELNKNNSCLCSHIYRSLATLDLEGHLLLIRTTKSKGPQKLTNCQRILTKKMWSPSPFVQVEVSRENQTNVFTDLCSPASYCSPIIWRSHNIFRMNSVTFQHYFQSSLIPHFPECSAPQKLTPSPILHRDITQDHQLWLTEVLLVDAKHSYICPSSTCNLGGFNGWLT